MKDDKRTFFDKELAPKFDAEKFLISKAETAIEQDRLEDAAIFLNGALLVNSENKEALQILDEIKESQVKRLSYEFIKRFYPSELNLFDIAWRVFKDIHPEDFKQEAVAGALGIVGNETSDINLPRVIVILNKFGREDTEALLDENLKEDLTKIGKDLGCSQELIEKIIEFILRG